MRKCAEEVRQKKVTKNMGYSIMASPSNPPLSKPYIPKPRVDTTSIVTRTEYTTMLPTNSIRKETTQMAVEPKSFMDAEDEEVSEAFEELMTEIAKYEGGDKKPQSKPNI